MWSMKRRKGEVTMKRKLISTIMVGAMVAGLMAGCGVEATGEKPANTPDKQEAEAAKEATDNAS